MPHQEVALFALLACLLAPAHAAPDQPEYSPGEVTWGGSHLDKGDAIVHIGGFSQFQLSDRVQLRSSLLATPLFPNASLHYKLDTAGDGDLSLSANAGFRIPWTPGLAGWVGGGLGYTVPTNNYRPDYWHFNLTTLVVGSGTQGRGGLGNGTFTSATWDKRMDDQNRVRVQGALGFLATSGGVLPIGGVGASYLWIIDRTRISAGAFWTVPTGWPNLPRGLAAFLPYPAIDLYYRF